jgi:hypothetical protein
MAKSLPKGRCASDPDRPVSTADVSLDGGLPDVVGGDSVTRSKADVTAEPVPKALLLGNEVTCLFVNLADAVGDSGNGFECSRFVLVSGLVGGFLFELPKVLRPLPQFHAEFSNFGVTCELLRDFLFEFRDFLNGRWPVRKRFIRVGVREPGCNACRAALRPDFGLFEWGQ